MPLPTATPRLSQPQQIRSLTWGISESHSQIFLPVLASRAKMSSLPVGMYITPLTTTGSASNLYLAPSPDPRRVIQAPLSCETFEVLIWFSDEKRSLLSAPPWVIQSFPPLVAAARSCVVMLLNGVV